MPTGFVHTWWYYLNSVGSKLPFKSIQMVFRGSIDSPLRSIQTRICISWPTIQNHLGNQHCTQLFHHSKPQQRMVSNGASTCVTKVPKVGGLMRNHLWDNVNYYKYIHVAYHAVQRSLGAISFWQSGSTKHVICTVWFLSDPWAQKLTGMTLWPHYQMFEFHFANKWDYR